MVWEILTHTDIQVTCVLRRAGIAQSIQRLATGWTIGVRFSAGAGNFSLRQHVQTGSRAHPASYPMGSGGSFPKVKAAEA
jgi:hypothetical protein